MNLDTPRGDLPRVLLVVAHREAGPQKQDHGESREAAPIRSREPARADEQDRPEDDREVARRPRRRDLRREPARGRPSPRSPSRARARSCARRRRAAARARAAAPPPTSTRATSTASPLTTAPGASTRSRKLGRRRPRCAGVPHLRQDGRHPRQVEQGDAARRRARSASAAAARRAPSPPPGRRRGRAPSCARRPSSASAATSSDRHGVRPRTTPWT